jgi:hypothetical protein
LEIRYITAENAVFRATDGGFISLDIGGAHFDRVSICRAFPFTDPDEYLSVRESDSRAGEIGIIRRLSELDEAAAALVRSQIDLRYFTPKIQKIKNIRDKYGYAYFDVLTDRGECRFTIRVGGGAVSRLSDTRLIFTDIDGNRFELPDVTALPPKDQRKIDVYI